MKMCEYCAKEISYHEMYCCDECEDKALSFFDIREKFQKLFSVINGVFVLAIGICIFLYAFLRDAGALGISISLLILGTMYFFLPFPPEVMIQKYKLKKAIKLTRIIAAVIFFLGVIALLMYLFKII